MPGIMEMPDNGNIDVNARRCFFMPMPINAILPAGVIMPYAGNTTPNYWLLCDGSAVSRTKYKELFNAIGTTYGEGDGNTTFNLPNLIDRFIEGGNTSGATKEAGLPNITGKTGSLYFSDQGSSGAFYPGEITSTNGVGSAYNFASVNMDASKSSVIYGKSDTVQPASIVMKFIIKT